MRLWELKVKAISKKIPHYGSGYTSVDPWLLNSPFYKFISTYNINLTNYFPP